MENKENESNDLFDQLKKLDTEQRNPNTRTIDLAGPEEIARLINEEDKLPAVRKPCSSPRKGPKITKKMGGRR